LPATPVCSSRHPAAAAATCGSRFWFLLGCALVRCTATARIARVTRHTAAAHARSFWRSAFRFCCYCCAAPATRHTTAHYLPRRRTHFACMLYAHAYARAYSQHIVSPLFLPLLLHTPHYRTYLPHTTHYAHHLPTPHTAHTFLRSSASLRANMLRPAGCAFAHLPHHHTFWFGCLPALYTAAPQCVHTLPLRGLLWLHHAHALPVPPR